VTQVGARAWAAPRTAGYPAVRGDSDLAAHLAGLDTLLVALAARRSGVLATIGEHRVFHTIDEAVGALTR
jgi:hypothetical protein